MYSTVSVADVSGEPTDAGRSTFLWNPATFPTSDSSFSLLPLADKFTTGFFGISLASGNGRPASVMTVGYI